MTTSASKFLADDLIRAQNERDRLAKEGIICWVVPIWTSAAGERVLAGYDVEVLSKIKKAKINDPALLPATADPTIRFEARAEGYVGSDVLCTGCLSNIHPGDRLVVQGSSNGYELVFHEACWKARKGVQP